MHEGPHATMTGWTAKWHHQSTLYMTRSAGGSMNSRSPSLIYKSVRWMAFYFPFLVSEQQAELF